MVVTLEPPHSDFTSNAPDVAAPRKVSQLEQRIEQLEKENARQRRYISQRKAIDRLPNRVLSPAGKIAAGLLMTTAERWSREGKTGLQPFCNGILADDMGMDPRAATNAMQELEDLGVVKIEKNEKGHGSGKRKHWKVEFTAKLLGEDPRLWANSDRRDPNGKRCECNASSVETVHAEARSVRQVFIRHDTRCGKCGRIHKSRTIRCGKGQNIPGVQRRETLAASVDFETVGDAKAYIRDLKKRLSARKTGDSCWSSNSAESPLSYASGGVPLLIEEEQNRICNSARPENTGGGGDRFA